MNNNSRARLARMANENNRKKNAAAIRAARKALYNKRVANAAEARKKANEARNAKVQAVKNRQAKLAEIRAMNNKAATEYFKGIARLENLIRKLNANKVDNKGVRQAYLNRYKKWHSGQVTIGARLRARGVGNGSVRASQVKQGIRGFFTTAPRFAKIAAYRPFARRANIAKEVTTNAIFKNLSNKARAGNMYVATHPNFVKLSNAQKTAIKMIIREARRGS